MIEREEQIFQLWEAHPFAERALQTADGKELRIISPGILNRDSGPDFFDARIEIDGQRWIGNIEIHVRASDWLRHGHTKDKAFSNVILHVVRVHDCKIFDDHGNVIPVLVLTDELVASVARLLPSSFDFLPADARSRRRRAGAQDEGKLKTVKEAKGLKKLRTIGEPQSLESLGVQRLYRRSIEFQVELVHLKGDMEALFQRHLFRRFGMRANSEPFQQLAHRVPGTIIRRQRNNLTDLEAILFGQSGLLPEIPTDGYAAELLYRFKNFRYKYSLEPMYKQAWKFMRMRPSNFPTIRLSQLAMLLHREEHLFARCMNKEMALEEMRAMVDVTASEYWDDHFRFGVSSGKHVKQMGEEAVDSILINAVAGLRYFLGVQRDDESLKDSAVEMLREIDPERNSAIRQAGIKPVNALQSQGVLELLTMNRVSNEGNNIVSENDFVYFSTSENHERHKTNRQNCKLVREPRVRRLRLVG